MPITSVARIAALFVASLACCASTLHAEAVKVVFSDSGVLADMDPIPCDAPIANILDLDCSLACECQPSWWSAELRASLLHRWRPDNVVLMADVADPANSVAGSDLDYGWRAGWEAALVRHTCCGWNSELRLFEVDGWVSNLGAFNGGPIGVQINTAFPTIVGGVTDGQLTGTTELNSLEFNFRRHVNPCVEFLAGVRYFELDDRLRFRLDAPPTPTTYDLMARNRLYGFQAGLDIVLLEIGCLTLDGIGKAGIFHNSGGHSSRLDTGAATLLAADSADRTSFVGEVSATLRYAAHEQLSLVVSYSALWLEGAALATEQVTRTDFAAGTGIDLSSGIVFHGAFLGIEYVR